MDLNRLRQLVAAPLASVLMIMVLCTFVVRKPASSGIRIPLVRIHRNLYPGYTCDSRSIYLRYTADRKTWINEDEFPMSQLLPRLAEILENRAERVAYIVVDSNLSYGQFMEFTDKIKGTVQDLHVIVISGEIRRAFDDDTIAYTKAFNEGHAWNMVSLSECDLVLPPSEFKQ
jgi:biopolymer transport protein ExbD